MKNIVELGDMALSHAHRNYLRNCFWSWWWFQCPSSKRRRRSTEADLATLPQLAQGTFCNADSKITVSPFTEHNETCTNYRYF